MATSATCSDITNNSRVFDEQCAMLPDTLLTTMAISPAQVMKFVKGIDFPANKQDIINLAQKNGAPGDVMNLLKGLPDQQYNNAADMGKGLGEEM